MGFRERLHQPHKGQGIPQKELVHTVGASRQAVQKWEAGVATPGLDNLFALADYFAVSLDYLVRGIEPEKPVAPSPRQAAIQNYYTDWSYEFHSRHTLLGLPLVHINLWDRGLCRTREIITIGNVATGFSVIGDFSAGLLSIGSPGVGLLTLGGLAVGITAAGGLAVGFLFALSGNTLSLRLALGGCAVSQSAATGGTVAGRYAARGAVLGSTPAIDQDTQSSSGGLVLTLGQLRTYGGNTETLFQMTHAQFLEASEWVTHLLLCTCP